MSDDYEKWPRDNGVEPERSIPWWVWPIIMMIGAKVARYLYVAIIPYF